MCPRDIAAFKSVRTKKYALSLYLIGRSAVPSIVSYQASDALSAASGYQKTHGPPPRGLAQPRAKICQASYAFARLRGKADPLANPA